MASPYAARSLRRRARFFLWLLILVLAFSLRFAPIRAGLPYLRYIDEGHLLHDAITMLQKRTLDTGFYNYPALPSYLVAGALWIYAPIYTHTHHENFWSTLQRDGDNANYYDYFAPTDVIVVGRCVVLLFSLGIVLLAGGLGNAIGGTRTGLLSLLLAAVCPALVSRGSILIVDTIATFFALASLCFAQRLFAHATKNNRALWPWAAATSAAAGLAFVSKYTAGAVFVAVVAMILLLRREPLEKLRLVLLSTFVFIATSMMTMPTLLTRAPQVFATIRQVARFYGLVPAGPGYFAASMAPGEMGLLLVLVSLCGIVFMLYRKVDTRSIAISWMVFALILIAALVRQKFQPFRNFLPLVPPLCIAAAFLIAWGHSLVTQPRARRIIHRYAAPIAAIGLVLSLGIPVFRNLQQQRAVVDSRVRALNWLGKNTSPNDRILALRQLAIHPEEWHRIGREPVLISWFDAADLIEHESFDHIVGSDFDLRFAPDRQRWSDYRDRWNAEIAALPIERTLGKVPCFVEPGVWRTNDERIVIKRGKNP